MIEDKNIVSNWNFSRNFPNLSGDLVNRPHFLETITEILHQDSPIVFLEGDAGDGATTTLAQFCKKFPTNSFSLFIKPASKFSYSPDYLRTALAEQIYWYVHGKTFQGETIDSSEFEQLIWKMRSKKRSAINYFIIDGIHQIPKEDSRIVSQIFNEILPIGIENCYFIVTGMQSDLAPKIRGKVNSKTYHQLKFRQEETCEFLTSLALPLSDCNLIHQTCKGVPGRIASVKRLLNNGRSLTEILGSDSPRYLEFIQQEFSTMKDLSESHVEIISILTFSKINLTIDQLSEISKESQESTNSLIQLCDFLQINSVSKSIEFISATHQKYAENHLQPLQRKALARQLDFLLIDPKSDISLRFLPTYFEALDKQEAIVNLLSKEHYSDLLDSTQSFTALKNRAEIGARSAALMRSTHDVFKFSIQKSIFTTTSNLNEMESQIEALVALGQTSYALALANRASAKEDRLSLLAAYARKITEAGGSLEPELTITIDTLIKTIDFKELGDKAINIASNILIFDADAAIGIIDNAVKGASQKSRDEALTELSLHASMSRINSKAQIDDKARSLISDAALQQFANSFSVITGKLNPTEVMSMASQMPVAHQLYFLRAFINSRRDDPDILDLIDHGLDLIVRESTYIPKAKDLAELAVPFMTKINDHDRLRNLVARFDAQIGLIAQSAQSKDLLQLQMRISAAEYQYQPESARARIELAYFELLSISIPEVKLESSALMLRALKEIDSSNILEEKDGFRYLVKQEMGDVIESVLSHTADHLSSITAVLKVLGADEPDEALALAAKINTQNRRDEAYSLISSVIVKQKFSEKFKIALFNSLERIINIENRSQATFDLLSAVSVGADKNMWCNAISELKSSLQTPLHRAEWDTWFLTHNQTIDSTFLVAPLLKEIETSAAKTCSAIDEIDIYFNVASALAKNHKTLANKYYEKGEEIKHNTQLNTENSSYLIELCISLVGRSFAPLARASMLGEEQINRYCALVDTLPKTISKVKLFCDLAERLWCVKRSDLVEKIIKDRIIPLVAQSFSTDNSIYKNLICIIFPVYSVWHLGTALDMLSYIDKMEKDSVIYQAVFLRFRKKPVSEPYNNGKFDHSKIEQHDVVDIISLLRKCDEDSIIYALMKHLVEIIKDKVNKNKFTSQQKSDWAVQFRSIINDKMPDTANIKHDGYKIVCLALTYALDDPNFDKWQKLGNEIDLISNIADRSFVHLSVAGSMHTKYSTHKAHHLESAFSLIEKIPSQLDRVAHFYSYAQEATANDAMASAKDTLRIAMKLSMEVERSTQADRQRRGIIDLADQIDPTLADELIELVDDDPARSQLKKDAKKAGAIAKAKRELANAKQAKDISNIDTDVLPEAAWKNLASLSAGRLETKPLDVMMAYVTQASGLFFHESYPVLCWHMENLSEKFRSQSDIDENITPICESLLLSTEIALSLIGRVDRKISETDAHNKDGLVVRAGTRDESVNYVAEWIRANAIDYIKYCDPYFSVNDIELLRIFISEAPLCKVSIIASKSELKNKNSLNSETFYNAWKTECEQDPPETEIIAIAHAGEEKVIIHDRWLITKGAGLRFGTSFNSLGVGKLSEISQIEPQKLNAIELQLDQFIAKKREIDGRRMQYVSFTLD